MWQFPKRTETRVIPVLAFILFIVLFAAMGADAVGWAWSFAIAVVGVGGLAAWSFRMPAAMRHRVVIAGRTLQLVDPKGRSTSISLDDVTELAMEVGPLPEPGDIAERTWLLHSEDRIAPLAIPFMAETGDAFEDWLDALEKAEGMAPFPYEAGLHVMWSKDPGWTAPPPPPKQPRKPRDPRMPLGAQLKLAGAFAPMAFATTLILWNATRSIPLATLAGTAWAAAIWCAARRNHPGIGYRLECADDVFALQGPRGVVAVLRPDAAVEVAIERRTSFLHGHHSVARVTDANGRSLAVPFGTAGEELLDDWMETLPEFDFDAVFDSFDDPPGVRRVAWTRPDPAAIDLE